MEKEDTARMAATASKTADENNSKETTLVVVAPAIQLLAHGATGTSDQQQQQQKQEQRMPTPTATCTSNVPTRYIPAQQQQVPFASSASSSSSSSSSIEEVPTSPSSPSQQQQPTSSIPIISRKTNKTQLQQIHFDSLPDDIRNTLPQEQQQQQQPHKKSLPKRRKSVVAPVAAAVKTQAEAVLHAEAEADASVATPTVTTPATTPTKAKEADVSTTSALAAPISTSIPAPPSESTSTTPATARDAASGAVTSIATVRPQPDNTNICTKRDTSLQATSFIPGNQQVQHILEQRKNVPSRLHSPQRNSTSFNQAATVTTLPKSKAKASSTSNTATVNSSQSPPSSATKQSPAAATTTTTTTTTSKSSQKTGKRKAAAITTATSASSSSSTATSNTPMKPQSKSSKRERNATATTTTATTTAPKSKTPESTSKSANKATKSASSTANNNTAESPSSKQVETANTEQPKKKRVYKRRVKPVPPIAVPPGAFDNVPPMNYDTSSSDTIIHQLCRRFCEFSALSIKASKSTTVDLRTVSEVLKVPRRRLYDVVHVLQGVGILQKSELSNCVDWKNTHPLDGLTHPSLDSPDAMKKARISATCAIKNRDNLRKEVSDLVKEEAKLDEWIKELRYIQNVQFNPDSPEESLLCLRSSDVIEAIYGANTNASHAGTKDDGVGDGNDDYEGPNDGGPDAIIAIHAPLGSALQLPIPPMKTNVFDSEADNETDDHHYYPTSIRITNSGQDDAESNHNTQPTRPVQVYMLPTKCNSQGQVVSEGCKPLRGPDLESAPSYHIQKNSPEPDERTMFLPPTPALSPYNSTYDEETSHLMSPSHGVSDFF